MKRDDTIPALELLETKTIPLAAIFAHELWTDHAAWGGADQRAREAVYGKAFTLLARLMYRKLITPFPPWQLTDKGRALLLETREIKCMLHMPLYTYDVISDWYDGPVIFTKKLLPRNINTVLLYVLMDRGANSETFLVSSLSPDQAAQLMDRTLDIRGAIQAAARHYRHYDQWTANQATVKVTPYTDSLEDWLPAPGEYFTEIKI